MALTAFVTYTVLAGGNAVGIRFSNRELAPLWGAGLRFALAAALFLAVMVVLRLAFPRGRALLGSLLYGLLNFAGSFGLIYYGLVQVHAGLGQILLALVPLATLLLAVLWRQERLRVAAVVGTLLGYRGRRGDFVCLAGRACRCSRWLAARSASRKPWCSYDASQACTR